MTGYVYVGFQNKRTKHGTFKIGGNGEKPKDKREPNQAERVLQNG